MADTQNRRTRSVDCTRAMIAAIFRGWLDVPLEGGRRDFVLKKERPRLIKRQGGICAHCPRKLDDDESTHIHHKRSRKEFVGQVFEGKLSIEAALTECWAEVNLEAVCKTCHTRLGKNKRETS